MSSHVRQWCEIADRFVGGRCIIGELRFDGRTAIVTGAGGNPSLGRAYALLLGARGANVVVNDIGPSPETRSLPGSLSAADVAAEIRANGGRAIADTHSVASAEGARAIVGAAIEAFGGIDILVNNAGVGCQRAIDEVTEDEFQRTIDINLMGQAWMCHAAWPHFRAKGYGRIVNIGSSAFAGYAGNCAYGASKGGVFSLTRALAADGAADGVQANVVNPGAFTRLVAATLDPASEIYRNAEANLPAAAVAPIVAFLAHEDCPVTGECFEAVGGQVKRIYLAQTEGIFDRAMTLETLAEHWDAVMAGAAPAIVGHGAMDVAERS